MFGIASRNGEPERVEIILPRARSIVWLVFKVYLIAILGAGLLAVVVMFLGVALIAAIR
jgi:hypothetical protein